MARASILTDWCGLVPMSLSDSLEQLVVNPVLDRTERFGSEKQAIASMVKREPHGETLFAICDAGWTVLGYVKLPRSVGAHL
ncbi:hypothetical protein VFPPC_18055 [Pochonia chlamydosporia 170]|uniref:Uncharacterized protein n=1 Tax=Pochonia chlamydosporia 170 TaxID=1380566 RepID=A0A219APQ6_METCM|nr:hypothetical protein VFPPC_18055 [Pochonia chlamydosporia 170]OWT42800.1 hypothetical protein VFPPC_18055 [Pochonia chlamydosporia 170]